MKKFILAAALVMSSVAFGQNLPTTVGTIPSKGGGELVFTSVKSDICKPYQYAMYIREVTGQVRVWGCYIIDGEQLMVEYLDGDFYSYPFNAMTFDPDWEAYLKREFTNAGT